MKEKLRLLKKKWLDKECPHFCFLCEFRYECDFWCESYNEFMNKPIIEKRGVMETLLQKLDRTKEYQEKIKMLKKENETLHGVIMELSMEVDKAEETCYQYQHRIDELKAELNDELKKRLSAEDELNGIFANQNARLQFMKNNAKGKE